MMEGTVTIVVLGDGETWHEIEGCSIRVVEPQDIDALMDGSKRVDDIVPIVHIVLGEAG